MSYPHRDTEQQVTATRRSDPRNPRNVDPTATAAAMAAAVAAALTTTVAGTFAATAAGRRVPGRKYRG